MNAMSLAQTAYTSNALIRTDRRVEYDAFARVTHQLKSLDPKAEFAKFVAALHENRKLWNLLAIDVADADNQLPQSLRARIFYLAEFTSQQTSKIFSGAAKVDTLVEINSAIMQGLRQQVEKA